MPKVLTIIRADVIGYAEDHQVYNYIHKSTDIMASIVKAIMLTNKKYSAPIEYLVKR